VILVKPKVFGDHRGFFMETYKRSEFEANGISGLFVQDNYSHSVRGTLRGLHYQKHPKAQAKLVSVVRGEIYDVAVDIRQGAPTYGRWVGLLLSSENHQMLYVPVGFAHGFWVLSEQADVVYKVTGAEYAPELERGISWNDPKINVRWPFQSPLLSERDKNQPVLSYCDNNFVYERHEK
ncbi:MAG: dTDP-4-dehydrorhamnose 3,5-epimerase, partial [Gammaproteobacteria bacterium]